MDFLSGIENVINEGLGQIPVVGSTFQQIAQTGEGIVNMPMHMLGGMIPGMGGSRPVQPSYQGNNQGMLGGGGGGGGGTGSMFSTDNTTTILLVGGAGFVVLFLLVRR